MDRMLAHVEQINRVSPIIGADRIESVGVLGWNVICKKDEYKVGDKVIYIEIDSKVPDIEAFEFLAKRNFKVKTIKLKNTISQGLVVSFDSLGLDAAKFNIGADLTAKIGIEKIKDAEQKRLEGEEKCGRDGVLLSIKSRHKKLFSYKWFKKFNEKRMV